MFTTYEKKRYHCLIVTIHLYSRHIIYVIVPEKKNYDTFTERLLVFIFSIFGFVIPVALSERFILNVTLWDCREQHQLTFSEC